MLVAIPVPALADLPPDFGAAFGIAAPAAAPRDSARELPPYIQCVPFARQSSGIQLYGDAWTWWEQAEGRYARGVAPRVGAVMAFRPHSTMRLGHVAAVSKVLDRRTVLLDHANWSPIDGRRGQVERGVRAIDVSPANDWSQVRVWYAPLGDLGTTVWPVEGFIYSAPAPIATPVRRTVSAPADGRSVPTPILAAAPAPARDVIGEILRKAR